MPMQKTKTCTNINGSSIIVIEKVTSVAMITIKRAIIESSMLVKLDITLDRGKMYLGRYTFFIRAAPPKIEPIAMLVASE